MRIDSTNLGVESPESSKTGRAGQNGGARSASASTSASSTANTAGVDQARFSFDQARVRSLQAQVLAQPEVREAKVQSLRQAINGGNYSVPASQVADALTNDVVGEVRA
jgi:flagellar biosynthesis anti-sigma factor FlgM